MWCSLVASWHCHCCGHSGHCCDSESVSGPGTYTCLGCSQKKTQQLYLTVFHFKVHAAWLPFGKLQTLESGTTHSSHWFSISKVPWAVLPLHPWPGFLFLASLSRSLVPSHFPPSCLLVFLTIPARQAINIYYLEVCNFPTEFYCSFQTEGQKNT